VRKRGLVIKNENSFLQLKSFLFIFVRFQKEQRMKTFSSLSLSLYLFATVNINKIQNLAFGVHVLPGKIEKKKNFFFTIIII